MRLPSSWRRAMDCACQGIHEIGKGKLRRQFDQRIGCRGRVAACAELATAQLLEHTSSEGCVGN
jgi:hypothetical protein